MQKQFTKQNPCNKKDIHNCFVATRMVRGNNTKYIKRTLVSTYEAIGKRVTGLLVSNERAVIYSENNIDYCMLTDEGKNWLDKGIRAWIANHSSRVNEVINPPK